MPSGGRGRTGLVSGAPRRTVRWVVLGQLAALCIAALVVFGVATHAEALVLVPAGFALLVLYVVLGLWMRHVLRQPKPHYDYDHSFWAHIGRLTAPKSSQ